MAEKKTNNWKWKRTFISQESGYKLPVELIRRSVFVKEAGRRPRRNNQDLKNNSLPISPAKNRKLQLLEQSQTDLFRTFIQVLVSDHYTGIVTVEDQPQLAEALVGEGAGADQTS